MQEICIVCLNAIRFMRGGSLHYYDINKEPNVKPIDASELAEWLPEITDRDNALGRPWITGPNGEILPIRAVAHIHEFPMCWQHALNEWNTRFSPSGMWPGHGQNP